MSARARPGLGPWSLLAVVFFNVSGGPYGIEDAVPAFGPGLALVLLLLMPLVWSLPVALAMGELASALPEEGGYVEWVRRAFGPFWGFQVGWWSWLNSFVDVAVYPALFVDYLAFWMPGLSRPVQAAIVLAFIWTLTAANLAGVQLTGALAVAFAVLALAPMAVFTAVAALGAQHVPWQPWSAGGQGLASGSGLGLAVMMWNYSGWDMPTTVLGETRAAATSFLRAQWLALPLIALCYLAPVAAALAATDDWQQWSSGHWPAIAAEVGGPWLAQLVTAGAMISTAGLFLSLLLTNSRLPFALAAAGQMPSFLARVHARSGTPRAAVVLSSAAYSACAFWSFADLIVLNIWLYSLTLIVELAAFVALRYKAPDLPRPWRVGGGAVGMWLTAALPAGISLFAMATAGWGNTAVGVAAALTGPLAYLAWRGRPARVRATGRA